MFTLNPFKILRREAKRALLRQVSKTLKVKSTYTYTKKNYRRAFIQDAGEAHIKPAKETADVIADINWLPLVKIANVIDGDTVVVKKNGNMLKVRLDAIDAPEDGQDWGDSSKYGLIKLIGGKQVHLEEHGVDGHGRVVGTLYIWNDDKNEWMNINERMVILGHAWVMRRYYTHLPKSRQTKLNQLERWAKSKKMGLWRNQNPIPPWQYRHN